MQSTRRGFALGVCLALLAMAPGECARNTVSDDPRLEKKITLELGLVTLEEFAEAVSKQTGVSIVAGDGENDWPVRERKMVVFARDVSAKNILLHVEKLHHYTLSRYGKEEKRSYWYWQDMNDRLEEEDLRLQYEMEPFQKCLEALNEMAGLRNAENSMTKSELDRLEKEDPYKHFLITDPIGQAECEIAANIPAYVWAYPAKWTLQVDASNPGLQVAVQRYLGALYQFDPERYKDETRRYPGKMIDFTLPPETDGIHAEGERELGFYGRVEIDGGPEIHIYGPDSPGREFVVKLVKAVRDGADPKALNSEQLRFELPDPLESTPLKDDPFLLQTVKIDEKHERDYAAWLGAIHKKTGWAILSDSYWEAFGGISREVSIKDILTNIIHHGKRISKEGSMLIISNKYWYEKRPADIPDSFLEHYTKKAKGSGLALDDLQQIALDLNDMQINKNFLRRDLFEEFRVFLEQPRQLAGIRFLALLTPGQKSSISVSPISGSKGSSLSADELPADALRYALQAAGKVPGDMQGKPASFSEYREPPLLGGLHTVSIILNLTDEQGAATSSIISIHVPGIKSPLEKESSEH